MNVKELKSLSNKTRTTLTPPPTQEGVRRSIRISMAGNLPTPASTTVQEEAGTPAQTYNKSSVKIPITCLAIKAFGSNLIKPLDLIIVVMTNANDFNDAHKDAENIEYEDTKEGAEDFVKWLYAVHLGLIKEIQLSVEADNEDLICYFEEQHCLCILPPLGQGQGLAPDLETKNGILQQLIEATNQNDKVCREMNRICLSEYEQKKDQDEGKKERTKDLHHLIKSMIKNASTAKRDKVGELCKDFLALYNSKINRGLDIKLCQLFKNDKMGEVIFSKGMFKKFWLETSAGRTNQLQVHSPLSPSAK
jgi:hypothetical protein